MTVKEPAAPQTLRPWIANSVLVGFAVLYCLSALSAPFWSDNDTWSNLLPIIHIRHSILEEQAWPAATELWYGGRSQWANPLSSFLYLPSTLIWLSLPLDWGARVVFLGHLLFALLAGRQLASLFLQTELERISAAVLFASPILAVLAAGHLEKVMSWGWILLALVFLLNERWPHAVRGLGAGICLGIVPLTGANYYTFYAAIVLLPLVLSYGNARLFAFFSLGALVGLAHLPNVWYMMGQGRMQSDFYIAMFSLDLPGVLLSLATGFSQPMGWETWAAIGIPMTWLFTLMGAQEVRSLLFSRRQNPAAPQRYALLISIGLLLLLATGLAYRSHDLLDLFRVPARALAVMAIAIVLFVIMRVKWLSKDGFLKPGLTGLLIFASAVQVAGSAWPIRPRGSLYSPYNASVQQLADVLKTDNAKSVWISTEQLSRMYVHVGLTRNNLALPNVYYGDMGQVIEIHGSHCGYSFDHLIAFERLQGPAHELRPAVEWSNAKGTIALQNLLLLREIELDGGTAYVYRVVCRG